MELEIFSPRHNGVRFFSALYVMGDIFFSAAYLFARNLFGCFFPLEISLQDIFFWKQPRPPQKTSDRPLTSTKHLVSWQMLICQPILKAFETIGDKTL